MVCVFQNCSKVILKGMAFAIPSYAVCPIIKPRATRAIKRRHREPVMLSMVLLMVVMPAPHFSASGGIQCYKSGE